MDISVLKRDPSIVKGNLITIDKTEVITKDGCKIVFPTRYITQGLAEVSSEVSLLGIYALIVGNKYAVSKALTVIRTKPDEINNIKVGEVGFIELVFYPKSTVIVTTDVIQNANLLFLTWDEFITKGKVPWFMSYEDLGTLFSESKRYTGVKLGANPRILELIPSVIARDSKDLLTQYRHVVESYKDLETNPPIIVKLNSVSKGATNTTAKLIGGYWNEGVNSALLHPSESREGIEDLLRR